MRRVAPNQTRLAWGRLGQHVAAYVSRWQALGSAAGHHDVGKVLAHALTLLQGH